MASGYSLGTAGGSLTHMGTVAAAIGRTGEVRTGKILDELARSSDRVVLHDLSVPARGITRANIDHVLVGGSTVQIIDSKVWKPGFYWTLGDSSFRGLSAFEHAGKKMAGSEESFMSLCQRSLAELLPGVLIRRPLVAVWSSKSGASVRTALLSYLDASVVPADSLRRRASRLVPDLPPEPEIIDRLNRLRLDLV